MPYLVQVSFNNIFPILVLFKESGSLDIFPFLFGNGLASSGYVNSFYFGEFYNPNAQIIRIVYEFGILGLFFFIWAVFASSRSAMNSLGAPCKELMTRYLIFALAGFFAHRSYLLFMLIGLLISVSIFREKNSSDE